MISNAISDPSETAVTAGEGASAEEAAEEAMAAAYTAVYEYEVRDVGNEDNGRVDVEVDGHPSCCTRYFRYTRHIRYWSGLHLHPLRDVCYIYATSMRRVTHVIHTHYVRLQEGDCIFIDNLAIAHRATPEAHRDASEVRRRM